MEPVFFLYIPGLLLALTLHEMAHGLVAYWGGDDTAALKGRITINPLPHIDLFGTIIFPLLLFLFNTPFLFGWAKPVPVDPRKLRSSAWMMWVSLAGPAANFLLLVASMLALKGFVVALQWMPALASNEKLTGAVGTMLYISVVLNFVLMFFNLLPIPPLDGSRVAYQLFFSRSQKAAEVFSFAERYGMILLILLFRPLGAVMRVGIDGLDTFMVAVLGIHL